MKLQKSRSGAMVGLVFLLAAAAMAFSVESSPLISPQTDSKIQAVPEGQQTKLLGIVTKRDPDSFVLRELSGVKRTVALTGQTSVKTHKKGVFRGGKEYGASYILRGLRLEASGTGNAQGQLVANEIKFDEDDLRTAQALEARVDPVEDLAIENKAKAEQAQASADEAMKSATVANNRINGLDEFDPVKTIVVPFATASSTLGPKAKSEIESAAAWVKTQDTKGWVVAVVGFADTSGKTEANRRLSERRANAVIGYLVQKHNLALHRLVQPFGYGEDKPVADNKTAEGRAKNRRAEIRLMVNRGIANRPDPERE